MADPVAVLKIGGSLLCGERAFQSVADALRARVRAAGGREPLVVVVSAEAGLTDRLLATARRLAPAGHDDAIDLLLSTGEIRSVALLVLALRRLGVRTAAANVHQTGLVLDEQGVASVRALRLRALLAGHDVVVVPGFLARAGGDRLVTLGRGGSDLSAVQLAIGLGATRCELIKDVGGYFSADPKSAPLAARLESIGYEQAIEMAKGGCALIQRRALEAARDAGLPIVVGTLQGTVGTVVSRSQHAPPAAGGGTQFSDELACGASVRE
jgi:aspartate kinase